MKSVSKEIVMLVAACSLLGFGASLAASKSNSNGGTISVSVRADSSIKDAKALGFKVGSKSKGGLGKSYSTSGVPINATYSFGYKTGIIGGEKIDCGSQKLTKDSTVTLHVSGGKCSSSVSSR